MKKIAAALTALIMLSGCASQGAKENNSSTETAASETGTTVTAAETADSAASTETAETAADEESAPDGDTDEFELMYDISPIVQAYESGDRSGLDEIQTQILDKAEQVIAEVIKDGMTDYEKELAIHDWLIKECTYDPGELRAIPKRTEHSDDPYGVLCLGVGICSGYTTAFQLLMYMLGIPCVNIHSTDNKNKEHAWNAVEIDGAWYYTDVTWDDPVPDDPERPMRHKYFNTLYEQLEKDHTMNEYCLPTESYENSYAAKEAVDVASVEDVEDAIRAALERNYDSAVIHLTDLDAFEGKLRVSSDTIFWNQKVQESFAELGGERGLLTTWSELVELGSEKVIVISLYIVDESEESEQPQGTE